MISVYLWLCKLQKRCTRLAAASDEVYQLLAHGRWFSLGTPASSTTKTGRHDIAENIVESGVKTPKIKISKYSTKKAFDKSSSFINICMTRYTCVYGGSVNEKPSHQ
jgi:hypothetical protein